jgi:serine phosphatase RsbU (regulator of sigma subunit)
MIDALLTGQPVRVPMLHPEVVAPSLPTEEVRAAWQRLNATSCTVVPLRARGETFGAIALLNSGDRPPHTDEEIATAVEVARRGALSLDNARLYSQQQAVAEKLQRSLLTDPPQPDDLELVVRYRPASSHLHVGGDWYDVVVQPDSATVAVIGDVVGHDIDAAAAMGQIRSMVRAIAYGRSDAPAEILARVDTVLGGLHIGTLATALVARIEQPDEQRRHGLRTLRWSSAGHLPPLLLHADGTVDALTSTPERLLGTDSPGPRTDHTAVLHPGDTLLLYTDGLVEHARTPLDEGLARLAATLAELHRQPLEALCDGLLERLLPGRADDDVALLAVRCHPQDADH